MRVLWTDLRYAWRRALRQPGVTLAIIALLALGTGGVTAVFTPIYSTLFAPLPFPQPEQLVRIGGDIPLFNIFQSRFEKEESLERIFSSISAYLTSDQNISTISQARIRIPETGKHKEVYFSLATEDFFETLGVKPLIGSGFSRKENRDGIIISYRLWRDQMMRADDAIGSRISFQMFSGVKPLSWTIVGIMPENFDFPGNIDIWQCSRGGQPWGVSDATQFIGRLRTGISSGQAAEGLKNIDFNPAAGITGSGGAVLQPLQTFLFGDQRPLLGILVTAAILFLVLVCAGVVNILIAQGARRKQEIATRLIYGATRRNLIFQLLRETLPLVVIGGLTGWWLSEITSAWLWTQFPMLHGGGTVAVPVPVKMAFLMALMLVVTLLGGLIPSLYATRLNLNTYLKSTVAGGRRFFSSREFLVGVQLGLALAMLIGMCVMIRSMMFRVDFPAGWSSQNIAVLSTHPLDDVTGMTPDESRARNALSFRDVQSELSAMPEVLSVGYLSPVPFSGEAASRSRWPMPVSNTLLPQGQARPSGAPAAIYAEAGPGEFDVLGIPFIAGRPFTENDVANRVEFMNTAGYGRNGGVAIINQALAQLLWPEENAVGKIFYDRTSSYFEVVGVVRNYHQTPGSNDFIPTIYTPVTGSDQYFQYQLLVKLRPGTLLNNFQSNVRRRLSGLAVVPTEFDVQPLSEHVKDAMANRRLTLQLLGCFAILGVIVSSLAIYATATAMAAARKREMGIRMAMGAQFWDILRLAFWRGIRSIFVGLPLGLFLAWILSRILSSFLVQVNVDDPLAWIVSCAALLGITIIAVLIPALRATRVNPLDAMRGE